MTFIANTEYEAEFSMVLCASPGERSQRLQEDRLKVCSLLKVDPEQDKRSAYELWGAQKGGPVPVEPSVEPSDVKPPPEGDPKGGGRPRGGHQAL